MRRLIFALLLCPLFLTAQDAEYLIFESTMLTPASDKVMQFEFAVAAHNKKFHPEGPYGCRVYYVASGVNAGKYMWNMGPTKWSALDARPDDPSHSQDWLGNVQPNLLPEGPNTYWRFDAELSRFPVDFNISKLLVWQVNITRDGGEKMSTLLKQVNDVYKAKFPNDSYGIYYNELASSSQGNDMAIVWFFDKYSWMSKDDHFNERFEEVHGAGSWKTFIADWTSVTEGIEREVWEYREDLSGVGPMVKAVDRQ